MVHDHLGSGTHSKNVALAFAITVGFMLVEATVGFVVGSLVLVADAGHMLTDAAGLSLTLIALWLARRPANARKTYGYWRSEILAALVNVLLLIAVSACILFEAGQRLRAPEHVSGIPLIIVASIGLCVNGVGAALLLEGAGESLNLKAAFLDMIGDVLGSMGAIATGVIILTTGWKYADPLFAAAVGLLILPRAWSLLKAALDVLLEGAPAHIAIPDVQQVMLKVTGVQSVHDLHVWTVTSGFVALSGHVQVAENVDRDSVLVALRSALRQFDIEHVTIQVENERLEGELEQPCFPGQTPCYADDASAVATQRARP
jgi:cobalt-zinc-cadmium efflux system protein